MLLVVACAPAAPSVSADAGKGAPLNPTLADGRLVYRAFDAHHPECFAFVGRSRDTETVECPQGALETLARCPGGRLFESRDGNGCICVLEDGSAERTDCP
jgi:hypothetical protein